MLYLDLIKEYVDYLISEGTVFNDSNISIHMDGSQHSNYEYDPYIKVYDGPFKTAKRVVRIYLKDAGLDYSHSDRFEKLKMTSKVAKQLNDIFKSTYRVDPILDKNGNKIGEKNITYYDYLWEQIYSRFGDSIKYIPCPDFTKYYIRKE